MSGEGISAPDGLLGEADQETRADGQGRSADTDGNYAVVTIGGGSLRIPQFVGGRLGYCRQSVLAPIGQVQSAQARHSGVRLQRGSGEGPQQPLQLTIHFTGWEWGGGTETPVATGPPTPPSVGTAALDRPGWRRDGDGDEAKTIQSAVI